MFTTVTNSARVFAREFENEVFRLVRSEKSFDKFASDEGIELKSKRGNKEGELKKRVAVWSAKAENGIIGNKKDVEKFMKLCEEIEPEKVPGKRGRKPKEVVEDEPKLRGPKHNKKEKRVKEVTEVEPVEKEIDIEIDVHVDYPVKHNIKEFSKAFKIIFSTMKVDIDAKLLAETLSKSGNARELLDYAAKTFK
jgi:hypothetical protein